MAFDQDTRNRLARFVSQARSLLTEEFTRQLQHEYGLDPATGLVAPLDRLTALDDARRETARILRETLDYYLAGQADNKKNRQAALDRILREQAFTVLNRLCALRMAEARGIILPAVGQGYRSQGFQLYAHLAGPALGGTGEAYQTFLFSLFDELAVELPPLFDRFNPEGRLFPRPTVLLDLLDLMNAPDLESLWAEDETIGWVYQYFNSPEERRAMRAASQAPRNSRELAVRNQFFTPRYVVEFLTDNTLGRIWYEMTKGETALVDFCRYLVRRPNEIFLAEGESAPETETPAEDLSQEELLRQPVYIPHRPLKDPRDIKMLDPACGSMHFGLYAFDLFERIYEEAWEIQYAVNSGQLSVDTQQATASSLITDHRSLLTDYPTKDALRRDIPRLIIEHNIHGIDIDPRAVQIAGLSLWLRAQKAWQAQGLKPGQRPQIRKSNIVCAEPMPGDRAMLEEFLATLDQGHLESLLRRVLNLPPGKRLRVTPAMADALAGLVRVIWDEMALAGEAGSLLKIEETLREAVAAAREASAGQNPLFKALDYDLGAGDLDFWDHAEDLVLAALQDYAEAAANGAAYRRRLFAGDAAQGFAFIQLCRRCYDVVLMNPPFGKPSVKSLGLLKRLFQDDWKDLYAAFFSRVLQLCTDIGMVGAITSVLYLYSKQLRSLRKRIIEYKNLRFLVELGGGVLDSATVETALTILSRRQSMFAGFIDLIKYKDRGKELLQKIQSNDVVYRDLELFKRLHNWPLCYHVDLPKLQLWQSKARFETELGEVVAGNHTFDDFRFLRLFWEVTPNLIGNFWFYYEKGGEFKPFLSPPHLVILWERDGYQVRTNQIQRYGTDAQTIQSITKWFSAGLSYPRVSSVGFSPKVLPTNCIFSEKGMAIFPYEERYRYSLLGLLASSWIEDLLTAFGRHRAYENAAVANLPIGKALIKKLNNELSALSQEIISSLLRLEMHLEDSPYFSGAFPYPKLKQIQRESLAAVKHICDVIDQKVEYSLFQHKSNSVMLATKPRSQLFAAHVFPVRTEKACAGDTVSICLGYLVGRWDIRYATGERQPPSLPDPFAPLPACPPGMLQNEQGLPAAPQDVPADYPLRISWGGVLVDDPGHPEDIVGRVREALQVIWGERAEAIEAEACQILGVDSLRDYFQKPNLFFDDHLKRYSKSRRYAPIYWPLSTASGAYTLWLYYHRLSDQTLYTCVNDFVDPKLKQVAEDLSRLRQKAHRSRDEEAELERLTDFEAELKDFREELLRVAAFWKPNLNDGVQITAAPLWKLFRHRSWQSRLRETWENLEAGEYDWAHLAYSIWPERVREKCKHDKSLAIAHDLEHLYVEPPQETQKRRGRKKADNIQGELDL